MIAVIDCRLRRQLKDQSTAPRDETDAVGIETGTFMSTRLGAAGHRECLPVVKLTVILQPSEHKKYLVKQVWDLPCLRRLALTKSVSQHKHRNLTNPAQASRSNAQLVRTVRVSPFGQADLSGVCAGLNLSWTVLAASDPCELARLW